MQYLVLRTRVDRNAPARNPDNRLNANVISGPGDQRVGVASGLTMLIG